MRNIMILNNYNLVENLTEATLDGIINWVNEPDVKDPIKNIWVYTINGITATLYETSHKTELIIGNYPQRYIFCDVGILVRAIKGNERIIKEPTDLDKFILGIKNELHKNKEP